jgi:hypothetical protein
MTTSQSLRVALIAISLSATTAAAQQPVGQPAPGRGGGPMMAVPERALVKQFDKNNDKLLDAAERKAAREWLASPEGQAAAPQPMGPPGGQGFPPGGRGGPPGGGPPGGGPPGGGPPGGGPPGGGPPGGGPPGGGPPPGGAGGAPPGGRGGAFPVQRGIVAGTPGPKVALSSVKPVPASVSLYDQGAVRTYFLEFENADWEQELEVFRDTDVDVPAVVTVDGKQYQNVGVHFRGASSYRMIPRSSKRSLNLTFDLVNENQALLGYRSINLLNANSDPTFTRTMLYSHIANQYLPAPRVNLSRVVINGESWGVYLNVQQYNKDFLRDFFPNTAGARWKVPGSPNGRGGMEYLGDDITPYRSRYEIKTKDNEKSWNDLINLFEVINTTPAEQLEAALKPILNVDGVLRFLALDMALVNTDGYWTRASDYNIYQDTTGKFHVLPHDMNEAMMIPAAPAGPPPGGAPPPGGTPPVAVTSPPGGAPATTGAPAGPPRPRPSPELDPLVGLDDATKPLRSKLLAVPAFRTAYLGYVRDIAEKWMDWKRVDPLVTRWQSLIAADVAADTRKLYTTEAFTTGLRGGETSVQTFMERRRAYLLEQLRAR